MLDNFVVPIVEVSKFQILIKLPSLTSSDLKTCPAFLFKTTSDQSIYCGKHMRYNFALVSLPELNPIPTRHCHVIYCCGDKTYSCLVGIELTA